MENLSSVALIPARSGSKRIPDKNIKQLGDHPLLAYTVRAAVDSNLFDAVICATDSQEYADIASYYGAEVPFLRSAEISVDTSPDIDWVISVLGSLSSIGRSFDIFSILRPTSPFRLASTIHRAWAMFLKNPSADSLRAVEKCKQHPGKMWVIRQNRMLPTMPFSLNGTPWHSSQYASLPEVYVQNASLEIAWTQVAVEQKSISGEAVVPFISQGLEGFDINNLEDWLLAEHYITSGEAPLPTINLESYQINE
mgnify:FL=1